MASNLIEEEDYASSEDSDFALDQVPKNDSDSEASDSEASDRPSKRRKVAAAGQSQDPEDPGYANSGDEAIIKKGAKKERRKRKDDEDEEGGEGGLIKTRRQRAQEKEEKRVAKAQGPVTIDVESVYAQMLAGAAPQPSATEPVEDPEPEPEPADDPDDTILIKRTYNFAGKLHTEEKLVPRSSAEAKLYLSQNPEPDLATEPAKRATKKAFRSKFEPLGELLQRSDLNLSVAARREAAAAAKKLNVVEKSRMDWAGYVDKEGIKDELELAGRSKGSYNARGGVLGQERGEEEDDARKARLAGRV